MTLSWQKTVYVCTEYRKSGGYSYALEYGLA